MNTSELLIDGFERVRTVVHSAIDGLTIGQLGYRPRPDANPIGWLVWHLSRVADDHLADAGGHKQVWTSQGWHERFGLPFAAEATGYGQSAAEVAQVRVTAADLADYQDAVFARTLGYLTGLTDADLDRVVDERWDPPVTLGVRLISVLSDDLQHAGQAGYLRGLLPQ
jgi:hypothetical protein